MYIKRTIYCSLVLSHLQYCTLLWENGYCREREGERERERERDRERYREIGRERERERE